MIMENQLSFKIKYICTNKGGEYINKRFNQMCRQVENLHQTTVPNSLQQIKMAERINRTLTERARPLLNHMQVEKKWWAEAINTAKSLRSVLHALLTPPILRFRFALD